MTEKSNENQIKVTYSFSSEEIMLLAKFLRSKQSELPRGLENFSLTIEKSIYDSLSLDEVKRFYS